MSRRMVEDKHAGEKPAAEATNADNDPATPNGDGSEPLLAAEAAAVPQEEYERLKAERDQLFDRLARLQAEFDNTRKREAKERADYRDYAVANAVEQFLPVLDNFQLALKSQGSAEQLRTGVELIVKQMEEALRGLNVQAVETVGAVFDPKVHEALDMVEREDLPDHQVFEEVRRGYKIRERLLRPALVRVASNTQQKEA
ncbi:MAG TPA: nucleotide exchange factor GrpE [Acidobacteriaceae bacterium]|jgi:molecular chaperone GrpE|nr:nucleotide exchange factor GrpE [Acidobacteriaceae bacterium]